jgi:glycosyltransferase involved in cell wall biosynthesis
LHILFNSDHYPTPGGNSGGIGVFVQTLGRMLVQQGHQVTVVGAGYKKYSIDNDEGVSVIRIAKSKWPVGKFIQQVWQVNTAIKKAHKQNPIAIIECSEVGFALLRNIAGVKRVIRMHGGHHFFIHFLKMKLVRKTVWQEKKSFTKADALCAVSHFVNEQTAKWLHFNPVKTFILYNGVMPAKLESLAANTAIVKGRIVFTGTVCEKKGASQLVQAFEMVKAAVPHATLCMVGPDWFFTDGSSYIEYLQQFIPNHLKASIEFVGRVANTEIPKWIASAEVCAYPSHMEAMPLAWLEAMALGKPIIASQTGPGPEVVTHQGTGLLCNPHQPESIAENLIRLLTDEKLAIACGQNAKQNVMEQFDMEKLVHQNIAFYQQVVDGN